MKQAIFVLSLFGSGLAAIGQNTQQSTSMNSDGRTAARDMRADATPAALPVMQSYVPSEIMQKATGSYGKNLYAVTQVKSASGTYAYNVTLLGGAETRSEFIGEDGAVVANVFRVPEAENTNTLTTAGGTTGSGTNATTGQERATGTTGTSNTVNGTTTPQATTGSTTTANQATATDASSTTTPVASDANAAVRSDSSIANPTSAGTTNDPLTTPNNGGTTTTDSSNTTTDSSGTTTDSTGTSINNSINTPNTNTNTNTNINTNTSTGVNSGSTTTGTQGTTTTTNNANTGTTTNGTNTNTKKVTTPTKPKGDQ